MNPETNEKELPEGAITQSTRREISENSEISEIRATENLRTSSSRSQQATEQIQLHTTTTTTVAQNSNFLRSSPSQNSQNLHPGLHGSPIPDIFEKSQNQIKGSFLPSSCLKL